MWSKISFLTNETFWSLFLGFAGLIIALSPRPSVVITVDNENSSVEYVSAELENIGSAAAYDFKFHLTPEIKTNVANYDVSNPQNPLFAKGILSAGQIYQGGRKTAVPLNVEIAELLVRYEIAYKYSMINIPIFSRVKLSEKIKGQLWWNGKKWDVR